MNNDKNKLEKFLPEFMAASFISKKVTANTIALINQFSRYFRNIRTQRQFYLDMLCLHLDIFHRLGVGLIKEDTNFESIPSAELVDERIGMISGMCVRLIEEHSKKFPFMVGIDLELLRDAHRKFYNWSVKFKKIYDKENALSVKFVSKQIVGFSIKGENTLVINFISKQIEKLSIKENDLDKFIFYLSDLIAQYLSDSRLNDILNVR